MTEKAERTIEKKWFKMAINFGLVAIFALVFFFLNSAPADAGNQQITFQGKLTNASGNSVSNGTYYVKLTIWDAASAGSCQYTASSTCASVTSTPVTVTNGIFSINLGDTSASLAAISPTLFNSSALYLGITVCSGAGTGCDSEMTPRKRITAAPYAFNADYLSGLSTSTIGGQSSYVPVTDSSGNLKISNSVFIATTTAGQFGVGTTTVPSGIKNYVEGTTATDKLLVLRGNSSQSGNLQEWQNSAGTALVAINSSGNVSTSGTLSILQDASSNTASILQLINYDGANTDKTLDFVLPGGSTAGTIQGLSAANRISIKAGSGNSLVIGAGQSTVDALAFSLNNVPVLVFDGVNDRAIFKSISAILGDGSTTSTLTKNSLTLGQTSTIGAGKFYIDTSGNVSASGSLQTFGNVTSTGHIYPATNNAVDLGAYGFAFKNTYASGTLYASSTLVGFGTAGAPTLSFTNNPTLGFYRSALNLIGITAGGTQIAAFGSGSELDVNAVRTLDSQTLLLTGDAVDGATAISVTIDTSLTALTDASAKLLSIKNYTTEKAFVDLNGGAGFAVASGYSRGKFNIDSSGNVSASGSLRTFGNVTSTGHIYPESANTVDLGSNILGFRNIFASSSLYIGNVSGASTTLRGNYLSVGDGTSSTIINGSSLTLGKGTNYNSGMFNVSSNGNVSASGSLTTFGNVILGDSIADNIIINGAVTRPLNISDANATTTITNLDMVIGQTTSDKSGFFYVGLLGNTSASGTLAIFGNSTLGDSDAAGGDTSRIYGTLAMGAAPTGNAQLYLKASSTTAVPMIIQGSTGGSATTYDYLTMWQDSSGNTIASMSTSTQTVIFPDGTSQTTANSAFLSVGTNSRMGQVSILGDGALSIRNTAGVITGILTGGSLMISGSGTATSTYGSQSITLNTQSGFNSGKFNVDSSGNVSASGTLSIFDARSSVLATIASGNADLLTDETTVAAVTVASIISLGNIADTNGGFVELKGGNAGLVFNYGGKLTGQLSQSSVGLSLILGDGSSTTTLTKNKLILGRGASDAVGKFFIDATTGNTSASGTLSLTASTGGTVSSTAGNLTLSTESSGGIIKLLTGLTNAESMRVGVTEGVQVGVNVAGLKGAGVFNISQTSGNINTSGTMTFTNTSGGVVSSTAGALRLVGTATNPAVVPNTSFEFWDKAGNIYGKFLTLSSNSGTSAASTTFTSILPNRTAGNAGFVFNTTEQGGLMASSSVVDRVLVAIQNNGYNQVLVSASGSVYAKSSFIANHTGYGLGDVAEYVNLVTGETGEPGDVLVVDLVNPNQYKKSSSAYSKEIAGVVSDSGAFIMGASGDGRAPLALAGLVKTKVTDENGPIAVGDYLVSASKPGYAMKYDASSGKAAGLVGMALEPLTSGDGKIAIMVNKGLVAGSSGGSVSLSVSQNESGQLVTSNDLDMAGKSIFNLLTIKSKDNKWMIDEDGYLIVKITTKQGDKKLYGLQSGQDKELVLSGSSQLENGLKKIELPLIDQEVIDTTSTIKVSVTLTGEAKGVFVSEKNYQGFTVKELGGGTSNATFDWMLIAKRRATDPTATEPESAPIEPSAPVAPEVASSTPSEESVPTPAPVEIPVETPPVNPVVAPDESPAPAVAEPVVPPAETPPAPPTE